jgi:hypothetical protein
MVSSSSLSSSDSSYSESTRALPPPIPDLLISSVLQDIPDMPEVEATHQMMEPVEMKPHADASAGMLLYILQYHVAIFVEFDIICVGAYDGGDADVGLRQMVQGQPSAGVVDEDEGQIIDYIEHVRHCDCFFCSAATIVVFTLFRVV